MKMASPRPSSVLFLAKQSSRARKLPHDGSCIMTEIASAGDRTFEDAEALARNTAEWLCGRALASDGKFAICCSGGSTPKRLYEILAEPAVAVRFSWGRVHWFCGDEPF